MVNTARKIRGELVLSGIYQSAYVTCSTQQLEGYIIDAIYSNDVLQAALCDNGFLSKDGSQINASVTNLNMNSVIYSEQQLQDNSQLFDQFIQSSEDLQGAATFAFGNDLSFVDQIQSKEDLNDLIQMGNLPACVIYMTDNQLNVAVRSNLFVSSQSDLNSWDEIIKSTSDLNAYCMNEGINNTQSIMSSEILQGFVKQVIRK